MTISASNLMYFFICIYSTSFLAYLPKGFISILHSCFNFKQNYILLLFFCIKISVEIIPKILYINFINNKSKERKYMQIVIGNIIALIASLLMVYSGLIKKKEKIIYMQTIQIFMFALSNLILGGITGSISNLFACIRNILFHKNKLKNKEKIILVCMMLVFSLSFNNLGIIGLLPLISTIAFTLFIDLKDIIKFKILIISTSFLWLIHDICIQSYISAIFDFMTIVTNTISIYKLKNKTKIL